MISDKNPVLSMRSSRYDFLTKWALIVPIDKKEEFEAEFLYILLGRMPIKKDEYKLSTAYEECNDDLAHR
jgi:hypothetical protein